MWTDNGGENEGDKMLAFLEKQRIYPAFTVPGNPQQNGKIEVFWKKLDKCCSRISDIKKYFYNYIHISTHIGLEIGPRGNFKRPKDIFYDFTNHWQRNNDWIWKVDGNVRKFPYDNEKKNKNKNK